MPSRKPSWGHPHGQMIRYRLLDGVLFPSGVAVVSRLVGLKCFHAGIVSALVELVEMTVQIGAPTFSVICTIMKAPIEVGLFIELRIGKAVGIASAHCLISLWVNRILRDTAAEQCRPICY